MLTYFMDETRELTDRRAITLIITAFTLLSSWKALRESKTFDDFRVRKYR